MKRLLSLIAVTLMLTGCWGYSSKDNELVGQVKKAKSFTPLICMDWQGADISLGVMRNGVGSMSTEDEWVYVQSKEDFDLLKKAAETGQLVKITYDQARLNICVPEPMVTHVELVK